MIIKEGYNNKPLKITISGRLNSKAEVWIKIAGLNAILSYASLQELADLKKEIEDAIFLRRDYENNRYCKECDRNHRV